MSADTTSRFLRQQSLAARRLNELEIQIKMARTFMKISNIAAVAARWDVSNLQTFAPGAREAGVDLSAYGRGMLETFTECEHYPTSSGQKDAR